MAGSFIGMVLFSGFNGSYQLWRFMHGVTTIYMRHSTKAEKQDFAEMLNMGKEL